jgi:hypothetical protein
MTRETARRPISVTLPASSAPPRRSPNFQPHSYLLASIAAPEFDGRHDCSNVSSPAKFVRPKSLTLTVARLTFTVANEDRTGQGTHFLAGCNGVLILDRVS